MKMRKWMLLFICLMALGRGDGANRIPGLWREA